MKKLNVLVFLLAVLFPSFAHVQTSYGRIQTDRIANKATIIITGATPNVSNGNVFKTNNGAPTTITNFVGGVDSQVITINCGETNTTIQNNANIVTATAADITCTVNKAQDFTYDAAQVKWVQKSGGPGGGSPAGNNPDLQFKNGGVFGNILTPTTPNGVPQTLVSTPSGGPTQAAFQMAGQEWRIISAASDTVVAADRSPKILQFTNTGGTTETVPDVGSAGFTGNPTFSAGAMNGVTVTFNRTSTSTFTTCVGYGCTSGLTTFKLKSGQRAHFSSPDGANWLVHIERSELVNIFNQYVLATGDDTNDGWTYQTAKKTIFAALQSLPNGTATRAGGGTIFVGDGVTPNPTAGAGIQIMGPNDPNYASPPAGWLQAPAGAAAIHIVGVGCASHLGNAASPACAVFNNGTGIWLSSMTNPIEFENLHFQFPLVVIRLGITSTGVRNTTAGGVQNVRFTNVSGAVNTVLGAGPAVDIGSDSYFIYFDKSSFQGNVSFYSNAISTLSQSGFTETVNTTVPNNFTTGMKCGIVQASNTALNFSAGSQILGGITVVSSTQFTFARNDSQSISGTGGYVVCDQGLPIVIDPGSGLGSGLLWFRNMALNGGGIRLWSGSSNTSMYVDGVTVEGDFGAHQTGPGVWVGSIGTGGLVNIRNVNLADTLGSPVYNVINDNYSAGGHVLYEGCAAAACATGNPFGSGVHLVDTNYYFNSFFANDCLKTIDVAANLGDSGAPCFQQGKLPQALDNFNRGSLGTNWTQIVFGGNAGTPAIASNQFSATSATTTTTIYEQAYTANPNPPNSTIGSNQWCEVTVTALTGGGTGRVGCGVRRTATTLFGTGYVCWEDSSNAKIVKESGSEVNLTSTAVTGVAGDVLRCEANGSTITMYRNGASILSTTDSSFTTGQPSLYLLTSTVVGLTESGDDWSGGSLPGAFATLDAEQSFREPQHFNSLTIGPASPTGLPGALPQGIYDGTQTASLPLCTDKNKRYATGASDCTAAVTSTLTNKTIDAEGTGNTITIPAKLFFRAAVCNNGTAALAADTTAASTVGCFGANTKVGVWQAADADVITWSYLLTTDFTGNIDGRIAFNSPDTAGTAIFNVALACVDGTGAVADDPAYNASSAFNTITLAAPANASWIATVSNITKSGTTTCSAGNWMNIKLTRATDTATSRVNFKSLELTARRAM